MADITENKTLLGELEDELRKSGECTVIDFFKKILPEEYKLANIRHEQEWGGLLQHLEFRPTIEGKKTRLLAELDLTIEYLENENEGEFRRIFGNLSQTTLDKAIDKIKEVALLFHKTSLWKELNHKEKVFFLSIKNLPSGLIKKDTPFKEAYKTILHRLGARPIPEKDKKNKGNTLNQQFLEIANSVFYDHFQVKLNGRIQDELKKYLEPSEYQTKDEKEEGQLSPLSKIIRVANDSQTSLSQTQTAFLFAIFQKSGFVFSDKDKLSNTKMAQAINILTGYSTQKIRNFLSNPKYSENDKAVTLKEIEAVKELIDKEL
jgi:hypothetical protein